ncbi:MAG: hypothetical protein NT011_10310 [Kiritimatiellaeota bacterium]|nr:hypothetical protein [Kiritimatiellota bacterium]
MTTSKTPLTSKDLIEKTFRKEKTSRIPVNHRGFSSKAASYILGREAFVGGGIQKWREAKSLLEGWHAEYLERSFQDATQISQVTGQDMMRVQYWRFNQKPTRKIDDYTFLFEEGPKETWQIMRFDPVSEQCHVEPCYPQALVAKKLYESAQAMEKGAAAYQPTKEALHTELRAQALFGDKVIEIGGGGVGIPHDTTLWLEAMLLNPEIVEAHIRGQVAWARKTIPFYVQHGLRIVLGGGDFASNTGPMYSPALFRRLILPGVKEIAAICHQCGAYYMFASDGDLWPVADALFGESGVDGYYEIDRRANMDLLRLRQTFPKLTLLGNISSHTVALGSPDDIKAEVRSCLEVAHTHGGIIVGISNYIQPETPPHNIDVLLQTIDENRGH